MYTRLVKAGIIAIVSSLFWSNPGFAQILAPIPPAKGVKILHGPEVEISTDFLTIIRWTSTNPLGDDDHYAVVHYGPTPNDTNLTAKNHIRLNRAHPETVFRARLMGLKPQTTYYYWVTSVGGNGHNDGVKSAINHFTTPAPGQRIVAADLATPGK